MRESPPRPEQAPKPLPDRPILHADFVTQGEGLQIFTEARDREGRLLASFPDTVHATWAPTGDRFACVSGTLEIRTLRGQVRPVLRPREDQVFFWHPAWSPAGTRVAAILQEPVAEPTWEHQADFVLTIVDAKKGLVTARHRLPPGLLRVAPTAPNSWFGWSPDGGHLLLSWGRSVVIAADSGRSISLSEDHSVAVWASSGAAVHHLDYRRDSGPGVALTGLFLRDLEEAEPQLLAGPERLAELGVEPHPGWYTAKLSRSPSGRILALVSGTLQGDETVGRLRLLPVKPDSTLGWDEPLVDQWPLETALLHLQWSPDESELAALSTTSSGPVALRILDVASGEWRQVASLQLSMTEHGVGVWDAFCWLQALSWAG
jgi:hypothetical protein